MASKTVTTFAGVRLDPSVYLGVSLQVMLTNKALLAVWALILAVIKMRLDVRLDILLSPETLATVIIQAKPLAVSWVWSLYKLCDIFRVHSGLSFCLLDVDTCNACSAGDASD